MKKIIALLLALTLLLGLTACGSKEPPEVPVPPSGEVSIEEPPIPQMRGLYETDPDEYGNTYSLEFYPGGKGIYALLDSELEVLDDMPFTWTDTNLYLNHDRENGQRYFLEGDTVLVHFRWFEEDSPMVFYPVEIPPEVGCYSHIYEEEFEGEDYVFEYFLLLRRNHTGTLYMQDVMPLLWEDGLLTYEDGTEAYQYTLDEEGLLHLHKEYPDYIYDEVFYPRDYGPVYDMPGSEFTMDDLEKSWALSYYVVEGDGGVHFVENEDVFCYLDPRISDNGETYFHFHWENAGGYIDVPHMECFFMEGGLDPNYYNSVWYANLTGTGTVKDRHTEERPYQVVAPYEEGTETQWQRMYASVLSSDTLLVRMESYVDGVEEPIVTNMFMVEAMG